MKIIVDCFVCIIHSKAKNRIFMMVLNLKKLSILSNDFLSPGMRE